MSRLNLFNGSEKKWFIGEADRLAENTRLRYQTPGEGKAAAYQAKYAEAKALDSGENGPFPHIEAEALIRDVDQQELASLIIHWHTYWVDASAKIEAELARCKASVRAADDPGAMRDSLALMRDKLEELMSEYPPNN